MMRRAFFVGAALCLVVAAWAGGSRAQKTEAPETPCSSAELEAKLNELEARQEASLKEINAKLDKIMENQEKIFKELEVVKIRATVRP